MKSVNDIRSNFVDYFHRNGHEIIHSSSLVPHDDPSLLFTNSGMVQFKNIFVGLEKPNFSRTVTTQKCVRAGGKHNDLDNVGYTARHHTFFEMLGNFSFGDYFKEEAIFFSWNFLIKEFSLPPEKLLVTVFHEDDEAATLWKKISGLPDNKIIRIKTNDNFWSMGEIGPCGPSSEIFYDHGPHIFGGPPGTPEEHGDRFTEIWNLVFMQFEVLENNQKIALPHPSIDTGMGLERIAAVMQGVCDNYQIDLFQNLIKASQELSSVKAEGEFAASHRVIVDHLRSSAFLLADGVLPSNEGRGYVLRRIMRRAMRHVHLLGVKDPLMYRLVPALTEEMGKAYPELIRAQSLISEELKLEETRFQNMLTRGISLLNEVSSSLRKGDCLSGEIAFKLYDTYGFPLDLTQDALRSRGIDVDVSSFQKAMEEQKAEARAHWVGSGEDVPEAFWFSLKNEFGSTKFNGYEENNSEGNILALIVEDQLVQKIEKNQKAMMITDQTPFYAVSGGQIGDRGVIFFEDSCFEVVDTIKKADNLFIHVGRVKAGNFVTQQKVFLQIDVEKRKKIRANHSATHLLHEALRSVLGSHIAQKGSLVTDERLRFDFSHHNAISQEDLRKIEDLVNQIILQNSSVSIQSMKIDDAISIGARALFGEKYDDEVRVVFIGSREDPNMIENKTAWSIELCGGTHVENTRDIGLFHIVSENGVSAGVRRIEALVGNEARVYLQKKDSLVKDLALFLKTSENNLYTKITSLLTERKKLEKDLNETKKKIALGIGLANEYKIEKINNISFMAHISTDIQPQDLRSLIDNAKNQVKSGVILFIAIDKNEKASIAIGVTKDLLDRYNAINLLKKAVEILGGKGGGGRPDMAQGGGPLASNAQKAIETVKNML